MKGIITAEEMALCKDCIGMAKEHGADAIRVSLSKSIQNSISVLEGEIDKICYSEDRSLFFHIFADGKYGTFSTNRLEKKQLESFLKTAVDTCLLMAEDQCRQLPSADRKAVGCNSGDELELCDPSFHQLTQERKKEIALSCAQTPAHLAASPLFRIESVECEYSDSLDDNYLVDSDGFEGRHTETSFGYCTEVTLEDNEGNKYSGYQWTASVRLDGFHPEVITAQAIEDAASQIGPQDIESGKYNVVVHAKAASRLVGPVLGALDGNSIQQKFSFLEGSLGEKVFTDKMTIYDKATEKGCPGSRLFDTEGVAVAPGPIIEKGVVRKYFVNTYCSRKTGLEPTVEGASRPCVEAFICNSDKKEINLKDIMSSLDRGVLITGFNGGNCNQATGNFSFGIEGFLFEKGEILYPFSEALMTGNMKELWNSLAAAGSDPRPCARWQIPSLAFENIEINA